MRHHTKDKGDLGELKAAMWFVEQGYVVTQPMTEHAPFDIIVYRDGLFWRVQVKYRTQSRGGLRVRFETSWADRHGSHNRAIDRREVDAYCIYEPQTDRCYFLSPRECENKTFIQIRFAPVANNQTKKIRFASTYTTFEDRWAANWSQMQAEQTA